MTNNKLHISDNKNVIGYLRFYRGQALITLLFFSVIALLVTSVAVIILITNSLSGTKLQQGTLAYQIAQTGIENATLRLLRDPNYSGETLPVGDGTAEITVAKNGIEYTILSTGTLGSFSRQIQVVATYSANLLTISSQGEVY